MIIKKTKDHKDNIMKGAAYAASAFFLLAMMSACAKVLSHNHHIFEVVFYRNFVAFVPMVLYIIIYKNWDLLRANNKKMMSLRVIIGVSGLIVTFYALKYLPISDATVLFMTSNLIIPVLAFLLLKEHIGKHRWIAIAIGFCGVVMVAGPTGMVSTFGVFLAIFAACFHAVIQILLRHLKNEQAFTVTFYFILGGVILPGIAMPWVATYPTQQDIALFIALGITGGLAQYCLTSAFKYAPASIAAPFNYTGLLWATGLDIIIWNYTPKWPVFIGGAIIVGAQLYIIYREYINQHKKS